MTTDIVADAPKKSHKLWGGRFGAGPTAAFDALNNSIGIDFRLWPHDIRLSRAWAVALWGANVLTLEESRAIEQGLDAVGVRLANGEPPTATDEDVHRWTHSACCPARWARRGG